MQMAFHLEHPRFSLAYISKLFLQTNSKGTCVRYNHSNSPTSQYQFSVLVKFLLLWHNTWNNKM
jgi:hypothetical protein